jgi:hypothetical protein
MLVRRLHSNLDAVETKQCDRELRRAGFLVRDSAGNYRFAHKSFREFFHAKRLVRALREHKDGGHVFEGMASGLATEIFRFGCELMQRDDAAVVRGIRLLETRSVRESDRALLVKLLSRTAKPSVIDALRRFIAESRQEQMPAPRDAWHADSLAFAVTALGWLDRSADPSNLVAILLDPDEGHVSRHNALIALCRSEHPSAVGSICSFVEQAQARQVVELLSSDYVARAIDGHDATVIADTVIKRCANDRGFLLAWETVGALESLCVMCGRSARPEADRIVKHVAMTANYGRAVAAAVLVAADNDLSDVEANVLRIAKRYERGMVPLTIVRALGRLGSGGAAKVLLGLIERNEVVASAVLDELRQRWPECVQAVLYQDNRLWRGTHWGSGMRLYAAELFYAEFPAECISDLEHILRRPKQESETIISALRFLTKHAPDSVRDAAPAVFRANSRLPVLASALECLAKVDASGARALAIEHGLRSSTREQRIAAALVLSGDPDEAATTALVDRLREEQEREIRLQLARAVIAPGRQLERATLERLLTEEGDREVQDTLRLALPE